MPGSIPRPRFASSLKESLTLPIMSASDLAAFRHDRAQARDALVVPIVVVAMAMVTVFTFWDIAREGKVGASALTRLAGAVLMAGLLALVRSSGQLSLRVQLILLYLGFYGWQLAIGVALGEDSPLVLPGLLITMFGSTMALLHSADTRINVLLTLVSLPTVLPPSPSTADWLYAIGLFGGTLILIYMLSTQMERNYAIAFLFHMRLQSEARTDPLTGLHNRRVLDAVLRRELSRTERTGAKLSVAILDLDHFKSINDQYGHAVGDEVLSTTSGLLQDRARPADVLVRLGGEEFGLVMVDTPLDDAFRLVEGMRTAIESHIYRSGSRTLRCTLSAGVTERLPGEQEWETMYRRADHALYRAKDGGRNQVRLGLDAS